MIVHAFITHPRDKCFAELHVRTYAAFCNKITVAVDSPTPGFTEWLENLSPKIIATEFQPDPSVPESRVTEAGVYCQEGRLRQSALGMALKLDPSLIVFGDTDEIPTPDVLGWIETIRNRPQAGERWYVDWVNLWGDYDHAIGGMSAWSFQNPRGNKKCLAMQPGGAMQYRDGIHTGMEPDRPSGGPAPTGEGRFKIDAPKLLHLKYGSPFYAGRPESKISRHQPAEMLRGGEVVAVPKEWRWRYRSGKASASL